MTPTLYKQIRETKSIIEETVTEHRFNGTTPAATIKALAEAVDIDMVKWILAENCKAADWDGRYSRYAREWANKLYIPVLNSENGREYARINTHACHINQLIEAIIKS